MKRNLPDFVENDVIGSPLQLLAVQSHDFTPLDDIGPPEGVLGQLVTVFDLKEVLVQPAVLAEDLFARKIIEPGRFIGKAFALRIRIRQLAGGCYGQGGREGILVREDQFPALEIEQRIVDVDDPVGLGTGVHPPSGRAPATG